MLTSGNPLPLLYVHIVISMVVVSLGTIATQETVFAVQPRSINATLNSTVTFTCETNVSIAVQSVIWRINGTLLLDRTDEIIPSTDGNRGELVVFCSENQNISQIECGLILLNFSMIFSDQPALLLVQGLLGPVTNLNVLSTTNTSITLTWDPPFSLDITGVEPDFTHTMEVYNVSTDGERELVNTTRNIINPTFTFSLVNPDPLDLFQFVVFAVNAVGEGERSDPVNASFSEDAPTTVTVSPTTTTGKDNTYADGQTTGTVPGVYVDLSTDCKVPSQTRDSLLVPVTVTAFIVGVILGTVTTLLIVLLITVYTRRHAKDTQQTASTAEEEEIELKRCDAYDVVSKKKKPKRRPVVNPPPVYEEVDL